MLREAPSILKPPTSLIREVVKAGRLVLETAGASRLTRAFEAFLPPQDARSKPCSKNFATDSYAGKGGAIRQACKTPADSNEASSVISSVRA